MNHAEIEGEEGFATEYYDQWKNMQQQLNGYNWLNSPN